MFGELELDSISNIQEMLQRPFKYKKIARKLESEHPDLPTATVRVIGGYTSNQLMDWLSVFSTGLGVKVELEPSPWGAAYALAPNVNFEVDNTSILLCLNSAVDLKTDYPNVNNADLVSEIISSWRHLFALAKQYERKIICTYFEDTGLRIPGIKEQESSSFIISQLNSELVKLSQEFSCLHLISIRSIESAAGIHSADCWRNWYAFGQCISSEQALILAHRCANLISGFLGKSKKVLVLDLDNTLWGGVIGDDGVDGIGLGDESYEGRIHLELQRYVRGLRARGVALAIASKNEPEIAKSAFSHPEMLLNWGDFSCAEVNWGAKSQSIRNIASKLNVGLDSIVFLDDNPSERDEVKSALPFVMVPNIEDSPIDFLKFLQVVDPFNIGCQLTDEDLYRNRSYIENDQRQQALNVSSSPEDYLKSLKTKVTLFKPNLSEIERVTQLTNKTNQFNFTTIRVNSSEVRDRIGKKGELILAAKIQDRFGSYGITSVIFIKIQDDVAIIENWIMSCRVFGKTAEHAIMKMVLDHLRSRGVKIVRAAYTPTPKNKVIEKLLPELGFVFSENGEDSANKETDFKYKIDLSEDIIIKHFCEATNEH